MKRLTKEERDSRLVQATTRAGDALIFKDLTIGSQHLSEPQRAMNLKAALMRSHTLENLEQIVKLAEGLDPSYRVDVIQLVSEKAKQLGVVISIRF